VRAINPCVVCCSITGHGRASHHPRRQGESPGSRSPHPGRDRDKAGVAAPLPAAPATGPRPTRHTSLWNGGARTPACLLRTIRARSHRGER
jgi:hypothetical protein